MASHAVTIQASAAHVLPGMQHVLAEFASIAATACHIAEVGVEKKQT